MNAEGLRNELIGIFGESIRFNRDFDHYAENLKDEMKSELISWCRKCKEDLYKGAYAAKPKF